MITSAIALEGFAFSLSALNIDTGVRIQIVGNADFGLVFREALGRYVFANMVSAPDDASAAASGVPVNGLYQNAGVVQIRLS